MAKIDNATDVTVQKRNDAYTGFLAISFLAMVGATVLLYLDYQNYEGKVPPKGPNIDVPGLQLKTVPNSGGAPKVAAPPPDEGKSKDMMFLPPSLPAPQPLPPLETAQAAPTIPAPPRLVLPDETFVPPATVATPTPETPIMDERVVPAVAAEPIKPVMDERIVPAVATEPAKPAGANPIISTIEPSLSDAPPLPTQRFEPPK
jgi:hypothetical protein